MQELNEIATLKIKSMIDDGSIESLINKNIESTIEEVIKDSLRSYGDFGKALKESVSEAMCIAGREIKLPEYNKFILQVVNDQFSKVLEQNSIDQLTKLISDVIEPVQKEAKISTVLNKVGEEWGDVAREQGSEEIEIDAHYNDDETALYATFKHPEYDFESVTVTFYNFNKGRDDQSDTWHIGYINVNSQRITGRSINRVAAHLDSITDILFKYYAMGTEFELDTEIESIYVGY